MTETPNIIVILGPTASGKTRLAAHLAYTLKTEVISADSRQVYKHMNIGTGKDYDVYVVNNVSIPYHLIDIVEPGSKYNIHQFITDFNTCFSQLQTQKKTPILCGGTGLYIQAVLSNFEYTAVPKNENLLQQLTPLSHEELIVYFNQLPQNAYSHLADLSTHKRCLRAIEISTYLLTNNIDFSTSPTTLNPLIIGLNPKRETRILRIEKRLKQRLNSGLIEEVEALLNSGITHDQLRYYGLEYKFVSMYLAGELTKTELEQQLQTAINQFAKRQMTYFRKMERDGIHINWIDGDLPFEQQVKEASQLIKSKL